VFGHRHSVTVLVVLLGLTVRPDIELDQGRKVSCSVVVLVAFHMFPIDRDGQTLHSPPNGVYQIKVQC
jgi:hypothetical protein